MKVTNTGGQKLQEVTGKKSEKAAASKASDKGTAESNVELASEVELSARAKDMKKIKDVAMQSRPDVDEAKVAKFQKLIDSGKYKVDAKAIADRLVDEHLKSSTDTE